MLASCNRDPGPELPVHELQWCNEFTYMNLHMSSRLPMLAGQSQLQMPSTNFSPVHYSYCYQPSDTFGLKSSHVHTCAVIMHIFANFISCQQT